MIFFLKKVFLHSWVKYLISFLIACLICFICLYNTSFEYIYNYSNASGTAGLALVFVGLISLANYFGAYDFFGYAFTIKKDKMSYQDYMDKHQIKRKSKNLPFGPYFAIGLLFLLISLIIKLCFFI